MNSKKKGGERDEWTIEQILHVFSWFQVYHQRGGGIVEAKLSKFILMMPKIFKNIHSNRIKEIKKIQVKIQEKTQDMQQLQEKHQDKYKKIFFFKRKDWIAQFVHKNFSKKNLLPEFLLSGNRLPEGSNRLLEAQTVL